MRKTGKQKNNGITLIALVITIIVLLILAGVTIATLMGDNGILSRATQAGEEQADAAVKEAISLAWNEYQIEIHDATGEIVESETKIASTTQVRIQGEEENYLAITSTTSFFDFLKEEKGYINEDGVIDVKALTGESFSKGNGENGVDVYIIEEQESAYILKYCGENGEDTILWEINTDNNVSTYPEATPESEFTIVTTGTLYHEYGWYGIEEGDKLITGIPDQETGNGNYYLDPTLNGEIVIPKNIKALISSEGFFKNCYSLKRIVIPNSVTFISNDIFSRTNSLTEISFPEGINPALEIPENKWGAYDSVRILVENEEIK